MKSDRFYWCTGCGKWHDPNKGRNTHYAMYCSREEPNAKNFEGTAEELERFLIVRELKRSDAEDFERRINDARISRQEN